MCRFDETELPPLTSSVPRARRWIAERLDSWDLPGGRDELLLAVSEMVSNAILHARSAVGVTLSIADGVLEVDVSDADPSLPEHRAAEMHDQRGRGLHLLDALSDSWGVGPRLTGKTVWFQLAAPTGWRYAQLCVCGDDPQTPARRTGSGREVIVMDPSALPGQPRGDSRD